jgi:hypothetical protein
MEKISAETSLCLQLPIGDGKEDIEGILAMQDLAVIDKVSFFIRH